MNVNWKVFPSNTPNTGILYVDHQKNHRSGHVSHALVEYKKGCVLSFYANCSGTRTGGHNGFGWIEYRRSLDNGVSWEDAKVLPYSWDSFINQPFTTMCEKAVSTIENQVVLFCSRSINPNGWEPWVEPTVIISYDGGETWSEPIILCDKCGRIYDAIVVDGSIYVLFHESIGWPAKTADEKYYIYRSDNDGKNFSLVGELPIDPVNHGYGNMTLRDDGALICYTYNIEDEYNMDYCISCDMGITWTEIGKSYCSKRIRNPQIAKVNGGYLLHGRSGCTSDELPPWLVVYSSKDGIHWDEGQYICDIDGPSAYYSNSLVLDDGNGKQKVLIQSSYPQVPNTAMVNIAHWFIEVAEI